MAETRIIVEPAKLTYKGGEVRITWSRIVETSVRHWGWTSFFVLIFVVGIVGGYLISGIPGVAFGLLVELLDFLVARKMVLRKIGVVRATG